MSDALHTALAVAVVALITAFVRGLPYVLFGGRRALPEMVRYLGAALPGAIMVILVVYCLRNIQFAPYPHGLPELIASAAAAGLQLWKRNAFASILLGTACYMILLRAMV